MTDFGIPMGKIRIFTDIVPDPNTTGGLVLDQIFSNVAQSHDLDFFIIGSQESSNFQISKALIGAKFNFIQGPVTNWNLGILTKPYSVFLLKYFHLDIQRISSWISQEDSRETPDHQIFVLQSAASIVICEKFRKTTSSYSTISFDPWRWWSSAHYVPTSLDAIVSQNLEKIYSEGFHLVPNSRWQELFLNSKGTFIDVYPTFPGIASQTADITNTKTSINFCFAGKPYALSELEKFIEFMNSRNWILFNLQVFLHVYGPSNPFSSKNIIYHGNLGYKLLNAELAHHDYALLPYPSKKKDEDIAQFSFPSKYLLYLSAGLPVIYIGNTSADVCRFTKLTGMTITPDDFMKSFETKFMNMLSSREEIRLNIEGLLSKNFSKEIFVTEINRWLGSLGFPDDQVSKEFKRANIGFIKLNFTDYLIKSHSSTISRIIYNIFWYIRVPKLRFIKILWGRILLSQLVIKFANVITVILVRLYNIKSFRSVFPSNR
jgi:regulator of replication initiation timing